MHDAARIVSHNDGSVRFGDVLKLSASDPFGHAGMLERKRAAKPAANARFVHLDDGVTKQVLEDPTRLALEAKAIMRLAGVVHGDRSGSSVAERWVTWSGVAREKVREVDNTIGQSSSPRQTLGVAGK